MKIGVVVPQQDGAERLVQIGDVPPAAVAEVL